MLSLWSKDSFLSKPHEEIFESLLVELLCQVRGIHVADKSFQNLRVVGLWRDRYNISGFRLFEGFHDSIKT